MYVSDLAAIVSTTRNLGDRVSITRIDERVALVALMAALVIAPSGARIVLR